MNLGLALQLIVAVIKCISV